jgi:hypothetical protein
MSYDRSQRIFILVLCGLGGLLVWLIAYVIRDSAGPNQRTDGTVVSLLFVEGMIMTNNVQVGEISVPIQTQMPGYWMAEIDSSLLGRVQVPVEQDKIHAGQHVYLEYHVGRLSGQPSVLGVRLEPEQVTQQ